MPSVSLAMLSYSALSQRLLAICNSCGIFMQNIPLLIARRVMKSRGDGGAVQPRHIREAHRILKASSHRKSTKPFFRR